MCPFQTVTVAMIQYISMQQNSISGTTLRQVLAKLYGWRVKAGVRSCLQLFPYSLVSISSPPEPSSFIGQASGDHVMPSLYKGLGDNGVNGTRELLLCLNAILVLWPKNAFQGPSIFSLYNLPGQICKRPFLANTDPCFLDVSVGGHLRDTDQF